MENILNLFLAQHKTLPSRFEIKAMVKLGRKIFTKKPS
jgi:hypothetical protein